MTSNQIAFSLFAFLSIGFFGYTCYKITRNFLLTKKLNRLDHIGKRIWIMLKVAIAQQKIFKSPIAGGLHALVFWGFIVITIGTLEMLIDGVAGTNRILSFLGPAYNVIVASGDIFAGIIILSCVIFLIRRYITRPKRFEAPEMKPSSRLDATFILGMIMVLMMSLIGMNIGYMHLHPHGYAGVFPVSKLCASWFANLLPENMEVFEKVNWWIHISLVLIFLNILPYSKHFHVLLSLPNVFFSRLTPKAQLSNMESITREIKAMMNPEAVPASADTAMPARFGVKDVEDINWKNLMDAYTCTECGRCTAACPANITGKKLSPRKLFIDLRARMAEKAKGLMKSKDFSDGKSLVGDFITEEELWACTSCMSCVEQCPVNIDHVPFIIDMRRSLVMDESKMPSEIAAMCTNIENNGAPWQFSPADRYRWSEEIYI